MYSSYCATCTPVFDIVLDFKQPHTSLFSLVCFIEKVSPVAQAVFEFLIPPGSASQVLGL